MPAAFCRLSSPCHLPESNRGLIHRQRNCEGPGGSTGLHFPRVRNHLCEAEAFGVGGVAGFTAA